MKTFHLVSLGCAKNTVDSQSMAQLLSRDGYQAVDKPSRAEILIVNTCGFIGPAKEESLRTLRELAKKKRKSQILIAAGCLTQRYGIEVARQVPGIDGILGTRRWMDIVEVVQHLREGKHPLPHYHLPDVKTIGSEDDFTGRPAPLRVAVNGASAYLKIADGCRRPCAFCAIPLIKGPAVSRPVEKILADARKLQDMGVREIILIAQDTTDYGHDLTPNNGQKAPDLVQLLHQLLVAAPEIDWFRILYIYPGFISDPLIELMATNQRILPYLDMPLQHAHPATLRRMHRPANVDWIYRTLAKMRAALPGLALRTTFIVGYPGETDEEFQTLLDFVKEIRFDRIGTFQFSFEPGTTSESLGDPVPSEVKQERYEKLMELQQGISLEINQSFIGKTLDVLIEGQSDELSLGRSYRDAPEIDGLVLVEDNLPTGTLAPVRITGGLIYDLTGVSEKSKSRGFMLNLDLPELQFAIHAVKQASFLVKQVQTELVYDLAGKASLTKEDRSPVTVADFAAQALIGCLVSRNFPADPLVAEEDSAELRNPDTSQTLNQVTSFVARFIPEATSSLVCKWIDTNRFMSTNKNVAPTRFWTLDPIDGTKGFLRGDQYAIALALVEDGQIKLGCLSCPNLSDGYKPEIGGPGSLVIAIRGEGTWTIPLTGRGEYLRLRVSRRSDPTQARLLRSFEAGHTNVSQIDQFARVLGTQVDPVPMDSQAKYAVLAAGKGEVMIRFLSSAQPDYREKIWDQAAGSIILEEAGGRISDLDGRVFDFTAGRTLNNNRGVLASNRHLHSIALQAIKSINA